MHTHRGNVLLPVIGTLGFYGPATFAFSVCLDCGETFILTCLACTRILMARGQYAMCPECDKAIQICLPIQAPNTKDNT